MKSFLRPLSFVLAVAAALAAAAEQAPDPRLAAAVAEYDALGLPDVRGAELVRLPTWFLRLHEDPYPEEIAPVETAWMFPADEAGVVRFVLPTGHTLRYDPRSDDRLRDPGEWEEDADAFRVRPGRAAFYAGYALRALPPGFARDAVGRRRLSAGGLLRFAAQFARAGRPDDALRVLDALDAAGLRAKASADARDLVLDARTDDLVDAYARTGDRGAFVRGLEANLALAADPELHGAVRVRYLLAALDADARGVPADRPAVPVAPEIAALLEAVADEDDETASFRYAVEPELPLLLPEAWTGLVDRAAFPALDPCRPGLAAALLPLEYDLRLPEAAAPANAAGWTGGRLRPGPYGRPAYWNGWSLEAARTNLVSARARDAAETVLRASVPESFRHYAFPAELRDNRSLDFFLSDGSRGAFGCDALLRDALAALSDEERAVLSLRFLAATNWALGRAPEPAPRPEGHLLRAWLARRAAERSVPALEELLRSYDPTASARDPIAEFWIPHGLRPEAAAATALEYATVRGDAARPLLDALAARFRDAATNYVYRIPSEIRIPIPLRSVWITGRPTLSDEALRSVDPDAATRAVRAELAALADRLRDAALPPSGDADAARRRAEEIALRHEASFRSVLENARLVCSEDDEEEDD